MVRYFRLDYRIIVTICSLVLAMFQLDATIYSLLSRRSDSVEKFYVLKSKIMSARNSKEVLESWRSLKEQLGDLGIESDVSNLLSKSSELFNWFSINGPLFSKLEELLLTIELDPRLELTDYEKEIFSDEFIKGVVLTAGGILLCIVPIPSFRAVGLSFISTGVAIMVGSAEDDLGENRRQEEIGLSEVGD